MKYKKAASQGAYIDRLRTQYPFRICRISEPEYEGTLIGVQQLSPVENDVLPIYRFPGGQCCEDPFGNGIQILEW